MLLVALLCYSIAAAAQPPYSPYSITQSTYNELLPILAKRHTAVNRLNSTNEWAKRQSEVQSALKKLFAPLPSPNRTGLI